MSNDDRTEFYVGYQKTAPPELARSVRRRIIGVLGLAGALALGLVLAQGRFDLAYFEFGNTRDFEGFVSEWPYPTLLLERPGAAVSEVPFSRYLLSVPGKMGAQAVLAGLDGRRISLEGTLVFRDDQTMIEVVPGSVSVMEGGTADLENQGESLGRYTLRGEIIDSKCYLGVMKPGNMKAHRSCAIRCISGGIPPVFVARDQQGNAVYLLLVGTDDRALNKEILDLVADPVEVAGEVVRDGALLLLRAEPEAFTRVY